MINLVVWGTFDYFCIFLYIVYVTLKLCIMSYLCGNIIYANYYASSCEGA